MTNSINKRRHKKGFTLIELVVVVSILGILSAIAIPKYSKSKVTASIRVHNANVQILKSAAVMYLLDNPNIGDTDITNGVSSYIDGEMPKPYLENSLINGEGKFKIEVDTNGDIKIVPGELPIPNTNNIK